MGGAEAVLAKARASFEEGDYRWVAEVVNHLVFADPENAEARELQADALEQLGYGAENATWRNFFLMGAKELREGVAGTPTATAPPRLPRPPHGRASCSTRWRSGSTARAPGSTRLRIDWVVTDPDEEHSITVRNGVLSHRPGRHEPAADAALVVDARGARRAAAENRRRRRAGRERAAAGRGRREKLGELLGLLDEPDPGFAIVTPE